MPEILVAGEALVEIMRPRLGQPLDEPGPFEGPFPSGAPTIVADTVGLLGHPVGFAGAVGEDDFGACILRRLTSDGVDTRYVQRVPQTTAMAFVTYFPDGTRRFLFHLRGSAAEALNMDEIDNPYLRGTLYLHLSGSTLTISQQIRAGALRLADRVIAAGGRLSFDPNFRPELLPVEAAREVFAPFVERAAILFPGSQEASWLVGRPDPLSACRELLQRGPELVVLKRGADGSTAFTRAGMVSASGFVVEEVDPTGAGDSFAAAFLVALLEGASLEQALVRANAVGAMAVTRRGPMEGTPTRQALEAFLKRWAPQILQSEGGES